MRAASHERHPLASRGRVPAHVVAAWVAALGVSAPAHVSASPPTDAEDPPESAPAPANEPEQSEAQTEAEAEATPSDRETARQLAQDGRELYWKGEYAAAIRAFESAYALVPDPNLLFNISAAYEKMQDYDAALSQLERYADAAPAGEEASIAAKRRELEQAQAQARIAESSAPATAPPDPTVPEAADDAVPIEGGTGDADPNEPPPIMGAAGWSLTAVTVVGLGVGIGFGVSAGRLSDRADGSCRTIDDALRCPAAAEDDLMKASRYAVAADVGFAVAAAAGVATLTLVGVRLARRKRSNDRAPATARVRWNGRALEF